ncbi:autorepressor SdpR family transcription factor [Clostridiisalibacter paucivorans]|uniref:autorepressor SdpR family transcription factor n=1 Tax=Clostridiisalibacter paucivorans TaxID=408753 RepID=UPI00047E502E|nr:autorepressor SdpR family transcription factor [Clostridiisalibacter paucivorans]
MNKVFKALADPTRRKILEILVNGDMTAGDIAKYFNISKPSISHHLSMLKNAELVLWEKDGQNIIYSLNTTAFQDIVRWSFNILNKEGERDERDKDK